MVGISTTSKSPNCMGQTFCLRLKTLFIGLGSMPYIYPAKTVLDIKVHGSQKLEIFAYTFFETKLELRVCSTIYDY